MNSVVNLILVILNDIYVHELLTLYNLGMLWYKLLQTTYSQKSCSCRSQTRKLRAAFLEIIASKCPRLRRVCHKA
jgi:hypothetical protein